MSEPITKHIAIVMLGGKGIGGVEKRFTNFFLHALANPQENLRFILLLSREKFEALSPQYPGLKEERTVVVMNSLVYNFRNRPFGKNFSRIKKLFTNYRFLSSLAFPIFLLINSCRLQRIIKSHKINVIHGLWDGLTECAMVKQWNGNGLKFLMSYVEPGGRFLRNRIYRNNPSFLPWVINQADAVEVQCTPYETILRRKGLLSEEKTLFTAPCSFSVYSAKAPDIKQNKVVFLARLDPLKNPKLFLEAAIKVLKNRKDIVFEMYGDGPLRKEMESYLKEQTCTYPIMKGFAHNPAEILAASKVFCSLTSYGSFPEQSGIEALAMENALITTESEGSAGFAGPEFSLVTDFDAEHLARNIEFLIDNPDVCMQMGKAGRQFVTQHHTIEKFSAYMKEVYKSLIHQ